MRTTSVGKTFDSISDWRVNILQSFTYNEFLVILLAVLFDTFLEPSTLLEGMEEAVLKASVSQTGR